MEDYKAILNRLRTQRANLDQAIAAMEKLAGEGNGPVPSSDGSVGQVAQVAPDDFFGMGMVEASKKYLRMAGRPARSTDEIADALTRGGLKDFSKDSLAAVLLRAASGREIVKVGKSIWGLNEWYPGRAAKTPLPKKQSAAESKTNEAGEQEED